MKNNNSIDDLARSFDDVKTHYVRSAAIFSDELEVEGRIERDIKQYISILARDAKERGETISYFNIAVIATVTKA